MLTARSVFFGCILALASCSSQNAPEAMERSEDLEPGFTYLSFTPDHGYQILFVEGERKSWLWYPGNTVALSALIDIRPQLVCFKYGASTYNPATRKAGGDWDCVPQSFFEYVTIAKKPGDAFGLSSGEVPYRRSKCDPTSLFEGAEPDPDLKVLGCG